ncbi:Shedu immune nuclease family protein [Burkholderia vietnamiensis]|uniref:Shedu immune nuclease family protein n=1 Tax=Burkholderia vietnamiensis TaxID=60552 RepID=UPI0015896A9A|nr:Shedu immune nuclease family protein [Burkholderia vietnamiensis]
MGAGQRIDILLVDASGNVDVIEIKKPLGKPIMLPVRYRDHHLPMRDLVGAIGQVTHYLRHLNRWGLAGEDYLTRLLRADLPTGFRIRIINPLGIVITGRSNTLSEAQRREFEVLRRDSKGVVDIITYDDLLARLQAVLCQLRSGPALSAAPETLQAE